MMESLGRTLVFLVAVSVLCWMTWKAMQLIIKSEEEDEAQ